MLPSDIKRIRKGLGFSRSADFAAILEIPKSTLKGYESGRYHIPRSLLILLRYLETDPKLREEFISLKASDE